MLEKGSPTSVKYPRWIRATQKDQLHPTRLAAAKKAFTTRRVPFEHLVQETSGTTLLSGPIRPRSGDLLLASVARIGHHTKIELGSGRRAQLHEADEIVVTYGDRYAPDQFEAEVPKSLSTTNLVASGGVAATMVSRHESTRRPTEIIPIGLIGDSDGQPINISEYALPRVIPNRQRPRTIAVIGTSMNSGKTTTVGSLILGLRRAGGSPGGTKVTGTGSGADYWVMVDAGAHVVADFTDVGLASTYRVPFDIIEAGFLRLVQHLTNSGCSDIVVEIADGILHGETADLIRTKTFRENVDHVVFAAADAMGASGGARYVQELGLPLAGVSGMFTRSPLAVSEAQAHIDVPVWSRDELSSATFSSSLPRFERPSEAQTSEEADVVDLRDGSLEQLVGRHL